MHGSHPAVGVLWADEPPCGRWGGLGDTVDKGSYRRCRFAGRRCQVRLARETVDFWNRSFAELGTPFKLGPVTHTVGLVSADDLKALSAKVLSRTGHAEFPESIRRLPGDVVVALSDGDFVSFAARWPAEGRALVGIRSHRLYPLTLPNVTRNVIAHELGHAIGLGHNDDPTMLMCGRPAPCRPDAFRANAERCFPLTDAEKA